MNNLKSVPAGPPKEPEFLRASRNTLLICSVIRCTQKNRRSAIFGGGCENVLSHFPRALVQEARSNHILNACLYLRSHGRPRHDLDSARIAIRLSLEVRRLSRHQTDRRAAFRKVVRQHAHHERLREAWLAWSAHRADHVSGAGVCILPHFERAARLSHVTERVAVDLLRA